jgi:hypothetical protein
MFKTGRYLDISLNEWIARMPDKMAQAHLKLPISAIRRAPQTKINCLPKQVSLNRATGRAAVLNAGFIGS